MGGVEHDVVGGDPHAQHLGHEVAVPPCRGRENRIGAVRRQGRRGGATHHCIERGAGAAPGGPWSAAEGTFDLGEGERVAALRHHSSIGASEPVLAVLRCARGAGRVALEGPAMPRRMTSDAILLGLIEHALDDARMMLERTIGAETLNPICGAGSS